MSADPVACESLLELFDFMAKATYSSLQRIETAKTTPEVLSVPNNGRSRILDCTGLVLKHAPQAEGSFWDLALDKAEVQLTVRSLRLTELRKGVLDISNGDGDYAIGPKGDNGQHLWFWW